MEEAARVRRIVVARRVALIAALALGPALGGAAGFAKEKPKSPTAAKSKPPPGEAINACGCYRAANGGCVCTDKKGKCECPGECEPVGCGEKRDKEYEREMAAEIKRAQEDEKRRKEAQEAQENGSAVTPDAGEAPSPPAVASKPPAKAARKDAPAPKGESGKSEKK